MKKLILIVLGLVLGSCSAYSPNFNIIFGSGFRSNSIDLTINDVKIMNHRIISSDTITGIVWNSNIIYKKDSLILKGKSNITEKNISMPPSRLINLILQIDGKPYYLQADLKKGGNILIDKHSYYYNVDLKQFKKNLKFE